MNTSTQTAPAFSPERINRALDLLPINSSWDARQKFVEEVAEEVIDMWGRCAGTDDEQYWDSYTQRDVADMIAGRYANYSEAWELFTELALWSELQGMVMELGVEPDANLAQACIYWIADQVVSLLTEDAARFELLGMDYEAAQVAAVLS